jgi:hypothetical protein
MSSALELVYPTGLPLYDLTLLGIFFLACGTVLRLAARPKTQPTARKRRPAVPQHVELPRQRTRTALTRAWEVVRGDRHNAA